MPKPLDGAILAMPKFGVVETKLAKLAKYRVHARDAR
jgi:hypothetical protein